MDGDGAARTSAGPDHKHPVGSEWALEMALHGSGKAFSIRVKAVQETIAHDHGVDHAQPAGAGIDGVQERECCRFVGDGEVESKEAQLGESLEGFRELVRVDVEARVRAGNPQGLQRRIVHGRRGRVCHGVTKHGESDGRSDSSPCALPASQVLQVVDVSCGIHEGEAVDAPSDSMVRRMRCTVRSRPRISSMG